ncbi:hypothetical protein COLO4_25077 [Corchorus olitorius]|uniref:Uncharacterized protein n=1 Tax=Corchorus olitorius TaxID=93759 RepID=A0A1R3I505_9ROSI|nr:hypothetical protein COLO4_25077 [Corchorus olitorius]
MGTWESKVDILYIYPKAFFIDRDSHGKKNKSIVKGDREKGAGDTEIGKKTETAATESKRRKCKETV